MKNQKRVQFHHFTGLILEILCCGHLHASKDIRVKRVNSVIRLGLINISYLKICLSN